MAFGDWPTEYPAFLVTLSTYTNTDVQFADLAPCAGVAASWPEKFITTLRLVLTTTTNIYRYTIF